MTYPTEAALAALAANGHEKGGAMPTNEEQYEAMVARGWKHTVRPWNGKWHLQHERCVGGPCDDAHVSACLLAGQLEAMRSKAHGKHLHAWVAQTGCDPSRLFEFYLAAFPLPSPPEPSAAEELAEAVRAFVFTTNGDAEKLGRALAKYDAATAGGR